MSGERRQRSPGLTIAILTKNEEAIIRRAIDSARWADEVLVVDSESVDRTREIAQACRRSRGGSALAWMARPAPVRGRSRGK